MAHELMPRAIRLHQTLHGYVDGHRLLTHSTLPKPSDLKMMLMMSDASGPGATIPTDGYLTGYPLPASGFYALAKTWAATEVSRPGCVWTHTLLLRFEDLALLPEMTGLHRYFRRPKTASPDADGYRQPIDAQLQGESSIGNFVDHEFMKRILSGLYGHPKNKIIATSNNYAIEAVMQLWGQQWPRLRRSFRFCTLSYGDRSLQRAVFDLQLLPIEQPSLRSRFTNVVNADRLVFSEETWLETALDDLFNRTDNSLRILMRKIGAELESGREAFAPLCRLHTSIMHLKYSEQALTDMLQLLKTGFDDRAVPAVRNVVVASILSTPPSVLENATPSLLENFELFEDEEVRQLSYSIGHILWAREPGMVLGLLEEQSSKSIIAKETIKHLSVSELLVALGQSSSAIPKVLELRHELLTEPDLWKMADSWERPALLLAVTNSPSVAGTLEAIIRAGRSDLATQVVEIFGSGAVINVLANTSASADFEQLRTWLLPCIHDYTAIAEKLSAGIVHDARVLSIISRHSDPESIPNQFGDDPWSTAIDNMTVNLPEKEKEYLAAYLMARALGYASRSPAQLIRFSFDEIYLAAEQHRLASDARRLVERCLPTSWVFWFDWDFCYRIVEAVVKLFIHKELSSVLFLELTKEDRIFYRLADMAATNDKGRAFLRRVGQIESPRFAERVQYTRGLHEIN